MLLQGIYTPFQIIFEHVFISPNQKKDLQQLKGHKQKINQNRQKMKMVMTFFLETGLKVAQLWEFSVDSIAVSGAQLGERAEASPALF